MTTSDELDTAFRARYSTWDPGVWQQISAVEVGYYLDHGNYRLIRASGRWIAFEYLSHWDHYGTHCYIFMRRVKP